MESQKSNKPVATFKAYYSANIDFDGIIPFEVTKVKFKKGDLIMKPGNIEGNIYFVNSGIIEASLKKPNQDDKILSFFFANDLFCSLSSYINQEPSKYYFKCLTNCTLEIIPRASLLEALEKSINANKFMRKFLEFSYLLRIHKEYEYLSMTPLERYNKIIKDQPNIVKHLPVAKIAKFIGIHPNSLSRLRKH